MLKRTMHLGSPCAKDILALDSFSVMIQEVFARILSVSISTIRVGSLGTAAATAIHFSISVIGGDLSIIRRPNSGSEMKTSFQREFISRNLSCTISLIDGLNASVSQNSRRFRIDDGDSESRSDAARHAQCSCGKSPLLTPCFFERQF